MSIYADLKEAMFTLTEKTKRVLDTVDTRIFHNPLTSKFELVRICRTQESFDIIHNFSDVKLSPEQT